MRAHGVVAVLLLDLWLAGCERTSTLYCEKHPGVCEQSSDAPLAAACTADDTCAAHADGKPYCLDMMACVGCRTSDDCSAPAATCDAASHACRGCEVDAECASDVCLASGACAAATDVAYVGGPGAAGTACTKAMPCAGIEDALALPARPRYIRLVGPTMEGSTVAIDSTTAVEILGGGNSVTFMKSGVGFDIKGSTIVGIRDVDIAHGNGSPGSGDDCIAVSGTAPQLTLTRATIHQCGGDAVNASAGMVAIIDSNLHDCLYGVEAFNQTALTIRHSTIHHNSHVGVYTNLDTTAPPLTRIERSVIAFNATATDSGGYAGLEISGAIAITNTIITNNGSSATGVGGMTLVAFAPSSLDFVTLCDNNSSAPRKAMTCTGMTTVTNSIITGNAPSTACVPQHSLLDTIPPNTTTNKLGDPAFVTPLVDPTDPTDPHFYRITATSAARDSADVTSQLGRDIDGDPRPLGMADLGADEYVP